MYKLACAVGQEWSGIVVCNPLLSVARRFTPDLHESSRDIHSYPMHLSKGSYIFGVPPPATDTPTEGSGVSVDTRDDLWISRIILPTMEDIGLV